jgi:hypothetical protein
VPSLSPAPPKLFDFVGCNHAPVQLYDALRAAAPMQYGTACTDTAHCLCMPSVEDIEAQLSGMRHSIPRGIHTVVLCICSGLFFPSSISAP